MFYCYISKLIQNSVDVTWKLTQSCCTS